MKRYECKILKERKSVVTEAKTDVIKFFEIPKYLKSLVYDGDESDLRLHADNSYSWSALDKKDYQKVEKNIDKFEIKGKGFQVYCWYDVSGYQYWMQQQEEPNYVQVSVAFDKADFPMSEIKNLGKAVDKAMEFAQDIEYDYPATDVMNQDY